MITCALVLVSAGQPLFTDDLWLHLALGEAYAENGLLLTADPHLFTASGPPSPAAWLADLGLYGAQRLVGFNGLRVLHVATITAIFALAWIAIRRAAGNSAFASASVALFGAISAYRLIQLRPELASVMLLLILYLLVFAPDLRLTRWRIALAMLLCALWANLHPAFVLAPILLIGVALSLICVAALCGAGPRRALLSRRAGRLGLTGGLCLLATLCNPQGFGALTVFWRAGAETPDLGVASDEWRGVDLFALPVENLPPSWLSWIAVWVFSVAILLAAGLVVRELRRPEREMSIDPGLLALATAALIGISVATRFLWLSIFCLLLIAHLLRVGSGRSARWSGAIAWASATAAIGIAIAFWTVGDWPMISRALWRPISDYARPFPPEKYNGHGVWMLRDAALEGHVYNDYSMGGFMSFWLAPHIKMSSSGSMNMGRERFAAQLALRRRQGLDPDETFTQRLDREGVDLFFGIGMPVVARPNRPPTYTTTHLERTQGWVVIFRNLDSAIYLRRNERNRANLERVLDYYRDAGVPFDPDRGFDPRRVIENAPRWAVDHGIVPVDYGLLLQAERNALDAGLLDRDSAALLDRLASIYASIGLYEELLVTNGLIRRSAPRNPAAARREIWALLRLERMDLAAEAIRNAAPIIAPDTLLESIATQALRLSREAPSDRSDGIALLPVLTPSEARRATASYRRPPTACETCSEPRADRDLYSAPDADRG